MPTPFPSLLRAISAAPGAVSLAVPDDWMQGRTVFGGVQGALALAAMRTLVPETPLRTLQGTFVAPVPGGTLRATARILRTGRSATQVEARIVDDGATLAILVGVFGTARPSAVNVQPVQPAVDRPQRIEFRYVPGAVPAFTQHFTSAWLQGQPPYTGDTGLRHVLEVGMRDGGPATEAHVLAIADFIAPVGLSHLKTIAPGSTLTWMIEFLTDRFDGLASSGWRVDAEMNSARDGYTGQSVMVWGPGGVPVAFSRQSMVVFG
jgi:acyl-CoA thioesterase